MEKRGKSRPSFPIWVCLGFSEISLSACADRRRQVNSHVAGAPLHGAASEGWYISSIGIISKDSTIPTLAQNFYMENIRSTPDTSRKKKLESEWEGESRRGFECVLYTFTSPFLHLFSFFRCCTEQNTTSSFHKKCRERHKNRFLLLLLLSSSSVAAKKHSRHPEWIRMERWWNSATEQSEADSWQRAISFCFFRLFLLPCNFDDASSRQSYARSSHGMWWKRETREIFFAVSTASLLFLLRCCIPIDSLTDFVVFPANFSCSRFKARQRRMFLNFDKKK